MKNIAMDIATLTDISSPSFLDRILETFESHGIVPEKVGQYEPMKTPYSREKAKELWIQPGGTGEFCRGSLICKSKKPKTQILLSWHRGRRARVNTITVFWYGDAIFSNPAPIIELFKSLIPVVDAVYGSVSEWRREQSQHIQGLLKERLPGIFWINFYSRFYLDFLNENAVKNAPWTSTEAFYNGLICTLGQGPEDECLGPLYELHGPPIDLTAYKKTTEIRRAIGIEYFGDPAIYRSDKNSEQNLVGAPLDMRKLYFDDDPEHIGGPTEITRLAQNIPGLKKLLTPVAHMDETALELALMLTQDTDNPTPLLDRLEAAALDYTLSSAVPLMDWLDIVAKSELKRKDRDRIILRAGAYLGEALRRNSKKDFHWYDYESACWINSYVKSYGKPLSLSAILYDMENMKLVYPLAKVEKYLDNGKSEDLLLYLQALTER